jgi:uncharacterized protein (DUF433 family)
MNGKIVVNPAVCHGKPCIAGTRIMVTNILSQLAGGYSVERILEGYPEITRADVSAAIDYAEQATDHTLLDSNDRYSE